MCHLASRSVFGGKTILYAASSSSPRRREPIAPLCSDTLSMITGTMDSRLSRNWRLDSMALDSAFF
ncbi:hypothetical protein BN2497_7083 [Janthinobacterium sp. CG23_2]|nr:hypothetical protein BN2497_7083 [Janthinobacterium sp. CG23_2]CUU29939.1 hypothetical protein BN3177_7083 [Janthinobacterium sp. CG23_2]